MTRERTKELMPVLQAWAEKKDIQVINRSEMTNPITNPNWETYRPNYPGACPDFSNKNWVWRVKPEPREFWAVDRGEGITGLFYRSRKDAEELNPGFRPFRVREVL